MPEGRRFLCLARRSERSLPSCERIPKNRETRAPLVSELLKVKDQLDPKYQFILGAPVSDSDGNPAQVRYSRKANAQYVMSEVDGKATKWKATYENGRWSEA